MSIAAMLCFVTSNLIIGDLSHMGFEAGFYLSTGAFTFSLLYFIISMFTPKYNRISFKTNGKFDFTILLCYLLGILFSTSLFMAINLTFYLCEQAQLNIGIA